MPSESSFPEPGSKPSLTFYYNKTQFSTEILASSENWTQYLEQTNLYSDYEMTNKCGYKLQNSTNGTDLYQYQGSLNFDNKLGSISFLNGDENTTTDPNIGKVYLDTIASGKGPFVFASGLIATVYPLQGDIVPVYVYLNK
jgi:hypothetical protein